VTLVGRTDRSGGEDYNQQLGLRRARAVFEALAARLPEGLRARLRVDVVNGTEAGSGTEGR
jgi:outer membrane protein OmpA-like peptidoglycan-associated protein